MDLIKNVGIVFSTGVKVSVKIRKIIYKSVAEQRVD